MLCGITQLFRGVDSYFWAIHDQKPEGIGATVHFIDSNIDTGKIILQTRPVISTSDSLHDLFFKSVQTSFQTMKTALDGLLSNKLKPQTLIKPGKLYQNKHFNEDSLIRAEKQRNLVLKNYLYLSLKNRQKIFNHGSI